ncbi:MAG: type 4a pilus biogenesis protein PilO [Polyangiaceae bacterium]
MATGNALDRMGVAGKVIISLVFVVLVGAVYFVVFFGELQTQADDAKNQEVSLNDQLSKAEDAKAAYQKDLDEKTRKQTLAREQKKVLPDDAEMPSFLSAIQTTASAAGVSLTSYTPQDEEPQQYYAKVPMALTLSGRFHQVARFFYQVGQLDRVINVEDIDIEVKKDTEQADEVVVNVKCLATAFRALRQGETAPTSGSQRRRGL